MKKHNNPYLINNPSDIFEVGANSSHPELNDRERVWHYKGHTFHKPEHLETFLKNEGVDPRTLWMHPVKEADGWTGHNIIRIYVADRKPKDVADQMQPLVRAQ